MRRRKDTGGGGDWGSVELIVLINILVHRVTKLSLEKLARLTLKS